MDPAIGLLRDLVAIDSVNPSLAPGAAGEEAVARLLADVLRRAGLDVVVQEAAPGRPNVIGVLEGRASGRTLMLCGHVDTVGVAGMAAPFEPAERDGRLYGRGAQDMKGGLSAMVDAARQLAAAGGPERGRVVVACVVDEEHSSIGAEALVRDWRADAAVVTEPTDLQIGVAHKGFAWLEIETRGRAAHGSRPAEGRDAIFRMGRVIGALEHLDRTLQAGTRHPRLGPASLHASMVNGGHEWSTYPDRCRLQAERRTLPGEAAADADDEARGVLRALAEQDGEFEAVARLVFSRDPYEIDEQAELPQALARACHSRRVPAGFCGMSFWTDAGILGAAAIPSVLFGPGGAGLHSIEEYVNVADVLACRDVLVELAKRFG
jgi:acetylornithine deacetylase